MKSKIITLVMALVLLSAITFDVLATTADSSAESATGDINYNILMVFVTEVDATLTDASGSEIHVNYTMSDIERQICERIPISMSRYLNELFEGSVNFKIDTYFTTNLLGAESFTRGDDAGRVEYMVTANNIAEVSEKIDKYESVITVFSMDDYEGLLHTTAGTGGMKYASIHLESIFNGLVVNSIPFESLLDFSNLEWDSIIDLFIHEFTHTIEQGLDVYEYHAVMIEYSHRGQFDSERGATRLYLLNEAVINGEKVGIPYSYWRTAKTPNLDYASPWAREGIVSAFAKGFIPTDLQSSYTNVITRQEFCRMAVKWLEYKLEKGIDAILAEKGLSRNPNAFSDTQDPDILAAYALGITSGTTSPTAAKPGMFTPNGEFSREQAATMIRLTCKAAGMDVSNITPAGFEDIGNASSWAVDGINFCYASGIMTGTNTSPLQFSPKMTYTREQSIVTFNNIK